MDVLLVIDMLNDFLDENGALFCGKESRAIIPFVKEKIENCRKSGDKVIYLCDAHRSDDKEFEMFSPHCVENTRGAEIIDELKPREEDIVIKKNRFSGFYGTRLEEALKEISPATVHVVGVCTSICVMDTIGDLRNRDYRVVVYKGGAADFDKEAHEFAFKRMADIYGAEAR